MNNCYCSIGHVNLKEDIDVLEQRLLYNYPVISKFNYITVYQNYNDSSKHLIDDYNKVWHKIFGKNVIILPSELSRGHTFGTADGDNAVINYAKTLPINFIYKSTNDVLLDSQILDIKLTDEYGFYFLKGIGFTSDIKYRNNNSDIETIYPQTNFYIITKNIDYLNNKNELDAGYEYRMSLSNYNGKIWEYIENFSCEEFLRRCVLRNKLKIKQLISNKCFEALLKLVDDLKIVDCSHKNIYFNECGICHYHYSDKPCIEL